ncbi:MAG: 3-deoxy-manno-octulosonate cytidylyltransferase [Proteobacteria bacterium]|nr:3-deoxy-manno-octulosonate cytidylyltransferase [Pseudomonadota bacterium]
MSELPTCYGIIPARYDSERFPGKPLALIQGKPMFFHVYSRAAKCERLSKVILATDDDRIMAAANAWEVPCVMTRKDHASGTDRVLEAAGKLSIPDDAVVINIQGDEPALEPDILTQLILPFNDANIQVTTPIRPIDENEAKNPDRVKVVFDRNRKALYFSRSVIPFPRDHKKKRYYGHIGLYAFRMKTLIQFVSLGASILEKTEKLEQLRLLENGIPIHVIETDYQSIGVDRPEDIAIVEQLFNL